MSGVCETLIGRGVPSVTLGEVCQERVVGVNPRQEMSIGRHVVVGMPGAHTPVCSTRHLPNIVENSSKMLRSGIRSIVCVVTSNPFSTAAWGREFDTDGRIRFLSDGNLEFARALGLVRREPRFFLGERSERYILRVNSGIIEEAKVEDSIFDVNCTRAEDIVELIV